MACLSMSSEKEYVDAYTTVARELIKEHEGDRHRIYDAIHEACYQHEYTCITAQMHACLWHSRNDDAYFEETGEPITAKDMSSLLTKLATAAFTRDVAEQIERDLETATITYTTTFSEPETGKVVETFTVDWEDGVTSNASDALLVAAESYHDKHGCYPSAALQRKTRVQVVFEN